MSDKRKRRCLLHELHKFVILPKHPNLSTSHPPFYLLAYLPIFFTVSFSSYRLPWASSPSINSLTMSLRPVHSAAAPEETRGANASSLSFSVLSGGVTSTPLEPDLPRPFAAAAPAPSKTGFSFAAPSVTSGSGGAKPASASASTGVGNVVGKGRRFFLDQRLWLSR